MAGTVENTPSLISGRRWLSNAAGSSSTPAPRRHSPKQLGDHIPGDLSPIKFAKSRQPYRDRGVQMPAGIRMRGVDAESYGKTPAEGDSEEVIAVPLERRSSTVAMEPHPIAHIMSVPKNSAR